MGNDMIHADRPLSPSSSIAKNEHKTIVSRPSLLPLLDQHRCFQLLANCCVAFYGSLS